MRPITKHEFTPFDGPNANPIVIGGFQRFTAQAEGDKIHRYVVLIPRGSHPKFSGRHQFPDRGSMWTSLERWFSEPAASIQGRMRCVFDHSSGR